MRLLTRSDFDGICCAVLLKELGVMDEMVQLQLDKETVSLDYKDITRARLINYNGER